MTKTNSMMIAILIQNVNKEDIKYHCSEILDQLVAEICIINWGKDKK